MKRTIGTKALSILLSMVMLMGLLPWSALTVYATGIEYNLYICGTRVTSEAHSGDGWSFDADTKTLTLNNFTYTGSGGDKNAAIYLDYPFWVEEDAQIRDLTINLIGDNVITVSGDNPYEDARYGIFFGDSGTLTIEGAGNLTVTFDDTNGSPWRLDAIFCDYSSSFVMNGTGTVYAKGGHGGESRGMYWGDYGELYFNSGTFIAESVTTTNYQSVAIAGNITVNGSDTVVKGIAPLDNGDRDTTAFRNYGITVKNGTLIAQGKETFTNRYSDYFMPGLGKTLSIRGGSSESDLTAFDSIEANGVEDCTYMELTAEGEGAIPDPDKCVLNVTDKNVNIRFTRYPQLPVTYSCNENGFGDLDVYIKICLFHNPAPVGKCVAVAPTVTGGNGAVVAGLDANGNQYVTINEKFTGTAVVEGKYNNGTEDVDYSLVFTTDDYYAANRYLSNPIRL